MSQLVVITETFVPGHPRTKGSLDFVGGTGARTYVRESVQGSKEWRNLVRYAVAADMAERMRTRSEPSSCPVGVRLTFYLPGDAVANQSGDLDKLVRNVLDALTDAGAYADDVLVAKLDVRKLAATAFSPQGVMIQAWEIPVAGWHQYRGSEFMAELERQAAGR